MTRRLTAVVSATILVGFIVAAVLYAQAPPATQPRPLAPEPWRRTGVRPCVRPGSRFAQWAPLRPPGRGFSPGRAPRRRDGCAGRAPVRQPGRPHADQPGRGDQRLAN